jgi:hypothetical protein
MKITTQKLADVECLESGAHDSCRHDGLGLRLRIVRDRLLMLLLSTRPFKRLVWKAFLS